MKRKCFYKGYSPKTYLVEIYICVVEETESYVVEAKGLAEI